jgi:hypothetical protein
LSGDLVVVRPGTYDEYNLVLPAGVALRGMSRASCIIADSVEHNDPMVTMGAGTALEHLTIRGNTLVPFPANSRTLVMFPGTTSADSIARQLVLESTQGNTQGISVSGSGSSPNHWVTVSHVDIRGNGVSNGVMSDSSGAWMMRDCICFGLVGVGVVQGTLAIQDTQMVGNIGLNIAAGGTVYVNQGTRWAGGTPLQNLGTLASAGEYLRDAPLDHSASHENGGSDEISVAGLSGTLADAQTPAAHAATHLSTGSDAIDEFTGATAGVDGLDGLVTKPLAGEEGMFLRGDGAWASSGGGVFGQDAQVATSLVRSTTGSSTFQTKLTLTTPVLTGTYRIGWMGVVDQSTTQDSVEARLLNTITGSQVGVVQRHEPKDTDDTYYVGGIHNEVFAAETKSFAIQWRQQDGGTAAIANAVIELWRVS